MLHMIRNIVKINKVILLNSQGTRYSHNESFSLLPLFLLRKVWSLLFSSELCHTEPQKKNNRVACNWFQEHVLKQPPYCFLVFEAREGRKRIVGRFKGYTRWRWPTGVPTQMSAISGHDREIVKELNVENENVTKKAELQLSYGTEDCLIQYIFCNTLIY